MWRLANGFFVATTTGMLAVSLLVIGGHQATAQQTTAEKTTAEKTTAEQTTAEQLESSKAEARKNDRDAAIAQRFVDVLMRRPRPGTALDRVIDYHVSAGTLDDFLASLQSGDPSSPAGPRLMIAGLILNRRGQPAAAAAVLRQAETAMPDDAAVSQQLAKSLLAVGKLELAAEAFERAIDRGPDRTDAAAVFTQLARIYTRAGQDEKAMRVWNGLQAMFPGDVKVGARIAAAMAADGDAATARERYQSLAKQAKSADDKVKFSVAAAELLRDLEKPDAATAELENVLAKLRPGSWLYQDVQRRLDSGFTATGDFDALADYYQQRLEKSPDDVAVATRLGGVLIAAGRLDDALEQLESILQRAPDDAGVISTLIDVQLSKGDYAAAAKRYRQLLENDPDNPDTLLALAQTILADPSVAIDKRRDQAADVWMSLAEKRGDDAVMLAHVADLMRGIQRVETALDLYKQAIAADPSAPQYREYWGQTLMQLDRRDEAIEAWRSIAQDQRRGAASLVRLAEVFATFDMDDLAIEAWDDAAEFDLDFDTRLRYAAALTDAGRYEDAESTLDAASKLADQPETRDRLLAARIKTYTRAGTLLRRLEQAAAAPPTPDSLRRLAVMAQSAGQVKRAAEAIARATEMAPEDISVLSVAADIAERQDRMLLASQRFETLADIDSRFRTNHLKRAAALKVRLGLADEAMRLADEVVKTNPSSAESHGFLARIAQQLGRDDDAEAAMRRAITVAPRDAQPRRTLAASLADQFRTDEAIDVYWEAFGLLDDLEKQISLVRQLAPLYQRQSDLESLRQRIEAAVKPAVRGRKSTLDARAAGLLIANAYESVDYYGQASAELEILLAQSPRDVSLVETMVGWADRADDLDAASSYAKRLVRLADTPEHRTRLTLLELEAGLIDIDEALQRRISLVNDPARIGILIRSALSRGDAETAKKICRSVLQRQPELWDVRVTLAGLLLKDVLAASTFSDDPGEADEKTTQIESLLEPLLAAVAATDTSPDDPPPTAAARRRGPSASAGKSKTKIWNTTANELFRSFPVGQTGSQNYSNRLAIELPSLYSFSHAKAVAAGMSMILDFHKIDFKQRSDTVAAWIDERYPMPPPSQVTDFRQIWLDRYLRIVAEFLSVKKPSDRGILNGKPERDLRYRWRMAELEPVLGLPQLDGHLAYRMDRSAKKPKDKMDSLSKDELERLESILSRHHQGLPKPDPIKRLTHDAYLQHEFRLASMGQRADQYRLIVPDDASLDLVCKAIDLHLRLLQFDAADQMAVRLVPAARRSSGNANSLSLSFLRRAKPHIIDYMDKHRLELLQASVAASAAKMTSAAGSAARANSTLSGTGTHSVWLRDEANTWQQVTMVTPLSESLLPHGLLEDMAYLVPPDHWSSERRQLMSLPPSTTSHLQEPIAGETAAEAKIRSVAAAYAKRWNDDVSGCYRAIVAIGKRYPNDIDLTIEKARLEADLNQPQLALRTLDSFEPLDSDMLVRKEMAAMNLAAEIGDRDRAAIAAERLFGLRMSRDVQLALVDQMRRLGINDRADAILQRARGGKRVDVRTQIRIAQSFAAGGDKSTAAEVAYQTLRQLLGGRQQQNVDYYQRQAVSILQSAGKMNDIIESAERRLESAPKAGRLRRELAALYTAAGEPQKASELWESDDASGNETPQAMIARAKDMLRSNRSKNAEKAVDLLLEAFAKQPRLLDQNWYDLRNASQQIGNKDRIFDAMRKIDLRQVQSYRYNEMIQLDYSQPTSFTKSQRRFVEHLFSCAQDARSTAGILRAIPVSELSRPGKLRDLATEQFCSQDIFEPDTDLFSATNFSGDGVVNGILPQLIGVVVDPQVRPKMEAVIEDAIKSDGETAESVAATAKLIRALMVLKSGRIDGEKTPASETSASKAAELFGEVCEQLDAPEKKVKTSDAKPLINGMLVHQAAQMVKEVKDLPSQQAIVLSLYRYASDQPSQIDQWQYTAGVGYLNTLVAADEMATAHRYAIETYHDLTNQPLDQYNPGYAESKQIQGIKSLAEKLPPGELSIDSHAMLESLLIDPEKFELVSNWGRDLTRESVEELADKTLELIEDGAAKKGRRSQDNAEKYLIILADTLIDRFSDSDFSASEKNDRSDPPLGVAQSLDLDQFLKLRGPIGIPVATRFLGDIAVETDDSEGDRDREIGVEDDDVIMQRYETLQEIALEHPGSVAVASVALAIGSVVDPTSIGDLVDKLVAAFPLVQTETEQPAGPEQIGIATTMPKNVESACVVALEAMDVLSDQDAGVTDPIVEYLNVVAERYHFDALQWAIKRRGGDSAAAMKEFLDEVERSLELSSDDSSPEGRGTIGQSQVETLLNMAQSTAESGDLILSARSLKLALLRGPPIAPMTSVSNAFSIQTTTNRGNDGSDRDLSLRRRVVKIVEVWGEQLDQELVRWETTDDQDDVPAGRSRSLTGKFLGWLGGAFSNPSAADDQPEQDESVQAEPVINGPARTEALLAMMDSLQAIVYPRGENATCQTYDDSIVSLRQYDNNLKSVAPSSAMIALIRVAQLLDQEDKVVQTARQVALGNVASVDANAAWVQAASVIDDLDNRQREWTMSWNAFAAAIDSQLPPPSDNTITNSSYSITSVTQEESYRKSRLLNQLLPAVHRAATVESLPRPVSSSVATTIRRLNALIHSDAYTAGRHRNAAKTLMKMAGRLMTEEDLGIYLQKRVGEIVNERSGVDRRYRQDMIRSDLRELILSTINDNKMDQATMLVAALIDLGGTPSLFESDVIPSKWLRAIHALPDDQRFAMLRQLVMTPSDLPDNIVDQAILFAAADKPAEKPADAPDRKSNLPLPRIYPTSLSNWTKSSTFFQGESTNEFSTIGVPSPFPSIRITDPLLWLADEAAKRDQTREFVDQCRELSSEIGDRADIAALLFQQAAIVHDDANVPTDPDVVSQFRQTLDTIIKRIETNVELKNDELDAEYQSDDRPAIGSRQFLIREIQQAQGDASLTNLFSYADAFAIARAAETGFPSKPTREQVAMLCRLADDPFAEPILALLLRIQSELESPEAFTGDAPKSSLLGLMVADPTRMPGVMQVVEPEIAAVEFSSDRKDGKTWVRSGLDSAGFSIPFPLAGDFQFEIESEMRDSGFYGIRYGGIESRPGDRDSLFKGGVANTAILTAGDQTYRRYDIANFHPGESHRHSIERIGDRVDSKFDGQTYASINVDSSSPFVSIGIDPFSLLAINRIRLTGNPVIPREVRLISETMRGWQSSNFFAPFIDHGLASDPSEAADDPAAPIWSVKDGELAFDAPPQNGDNNMRFDAFSRSATVWYDWPLRKGDRVTGEFYFEADRCGCTWLIDSLQLVATADRVFAIPISADGASVSEEVVSRFPLCDDVQIDVDNAPVEGWNTVTIVNQGERTRVTLNGELLISVPNSSSNSSSSSMSSAVDFGLRPTGEKMRVRNLVLTGDWPEQVPEQFLLP